MQGGRWRELTELVNEVLEVPPAQRSGFLDRLCDDDEVLRAELEALLVAEEEAGDFLLSPIFSLHDDGPSVDEVGRRIGAYRLLRPLGRGGMGTVWLATRDDGVFDQEVAIKILKRGMDTDEIVRRFEAERQILASLVHPGIASLLDGGTTDDGLPYFVMEHVDGRPIDVYCAEQGLGVHQRLELVLEVCEAVAAAHRSLVVHRDLKPANILVDREGHLKLLDFGIAKVLGPDDGPQVTQTRRLAPLTPHYASPEQLEGGGITTATDVYALGVLLYELLTGRRPFEFDAASPEAAAEVVRSRQPTRPSTAVVRVSQRSALTEGDEEAPRGTSPPGAPRQLRKALAGDIDTLVLTAMRKEPERRFPSVDQFAEDIR
ncbi:MAG: serine/threonine-protein kinase, partial [Acidobacteriota bacterium]